MTIDKWKLREFMDNPNDDFAQAIERWLQPYQTNWPPVLNGGRVYDPRKYELVPRPEYKKELISIKEQKLKEIEEQAEAIKKEIQLLKQK